MGREDSGRGPVRRVGLYVSLHRDNAREAAGPLAAALCERGVQVRAAEDVAKATGISCDIVCHDEVVEADLVIVLGGDGSLLHAARRAAPLGVAVLGIDMGSFGFLADSKLEVLHERLDIILAGRFQIDQRMMLEVAVRRGDEEHGPWLGLNDAVMGVLSYSHVLRFRISLDDEEVANYSSDGLIVATPTGSTAYSLSAGGPVVEAEVESFIITPICPHTLQSRPVVISPETVVSVRIARSNSDLSDVVLDVDGQHVMNLESEDVVVIRRAASRAPLVRAGATTFYSRLRDKLNWGLSH